MFDITNSIGIIVAAIAGYTIGMVWYSPLLFMKPWLSALGKTEEELKKPQEHKTKSYMTGLMLYTFFVTFAVAFALSSVLEFMGATSFIEVVGVSMLLCFGFIVTTKFTDMLYTLEGPHWGLRVQKLFFINTGYYVVTFFAMGVILYFLG